MEISVSAPTFVVVKQCGHMTKSHVHSNLLMHELQLLHLLIYLFLLATTCPAAIDLRGRKIWGRAHIVMYAIGYHFRWKVIVL